MTTEVAMVNNGKGSRDERLKRYLVDFLFRNARRDCVEMVVLLQAEFNPSSTRFCLQSLCFEKDIRLSEIQDASVL